MVKPGMTPDEAVDEIERMTREEQEQVLQLREAEIAVQAAKVAEDRARATLERTQKDKVHAFAMLNSISLMARSGVLRDAAANAQRELDATRKN